MNYVFECVNNHMIASTYYILWMSRELIWWRTTPVATKSQHHGAGRADTHARPAPTIDEDEGCRVSLHRLRTSSCPTQSSRAWIYLLSSFWTLAAHICFSGPSPFCASRWALPPFEPHSRWWVLCGLQANQTFIFCLYSLKWTFIHCHSCVMSVINSMNICNDQVNYDEIMIQNHWSLNICSKYFYS